MKNFFTIFYFFILFHKLSIAQQIPTFADLPGPEHVLVVYNLNSGVSDSVKQYYKGARQIPTSNILGLDSLIDINIYDSVSNTTHHVRIVQQGEIIEDADNEDNSIATPTRHSWIYFNERIAKPIAEYLKTTIVNGDTLKNKIRFIVLSKGIPFRLHSRWSGWASWSYRQNVPICFLLSLLGETIEDEDALLEYLNLDVAFGNPYSINNPYFNADPNFSMDHFFVPNHYKGLAQVFGQTRDISLSYLVSHLSAPRFSDITGMIDRSIDAINATNYDWFMDADDRSIPGGPYLKQEAEATEVIFNDLGIANYYFEKTSDTITSHIKPIMTYSSNGVHAGFPSDYIQTRLNFTYAAGAFFNTAESYNGESIGTFPVVRPTGHGSVADFTFTGGTIGVGHSYEPTTTNVVKNSIMFPSYTLGYSFIEAAYLGMPSLTGENVLVGDPLTRITFPCEPTVITQNTILSSGDYNCDIIVPNGITLTIDESALVSLNQNAQLIIYGTLNILESSVLNFNAYSELRLEIGSDLIVQQEAEVNFTDRSTFTINVNFVFEDNSPFSFEDDCNIVINGTAEISEGSTFNLSSNVSCKVYGLFALNEQSILNLQNSSSLTSNGRLKANPGSIINVNNNSKFISNKELTLSEGVSLNLQYSFPGEFRLGGIVKSLGSINDSVTINCSPGSNTFHCVNVDTLLMQNTIIDSGRIFLVVSDGIVKPRLLSISNSAIYNSPGYNLFVANNTAGADIILSDNFISTNDQFNHGLLFIGFHKVQLLRNFIQSEVFTFSAGIFILDNETTEIDGCIISNFSYGILRGDPIPEEIEDHIPTYSEDINVFGCTFNGGQDNSGIGIGIGMTQNNEITAVNIEQNDILDFQSGIVINNADNFPLLVQNNAIGNYELFGISLSNGNEGILKANTITPNVSASEGCIGIFVSQVDYPRIIDNIVNAQGVANPGPGIFLVSSDGEIRMNSIQYHKNGVELGSSSSKIGANLITDNHNYGIYINNNSHPDLSEAFSGEEEYPISGYNIIRENGGCNLYSYSELYLNRSTVNLEKGCNTIADDREEDPMLHCNHLYLIDGIKVSGTIKANRNYWGNHPIYGNDPTGRFGQQISIDYSDYLTEPCTFFEQGAVELILTDSKGEAYDTVYSTGDTPTNLTDIELRYASANDYYYHNQYSQATQEYEGIIQNYGDSTASLQAYNQLFTLANLMDNPPGSFNQLSVFYLQQAENQTDSSIIETLIHLSDLCLVSAEEYLPAINNFDEIAQQNPNTEVALYRNVDALATALLLPQDSTMNKGILGKYSVDDLSDYAKKLSELIKTRGKSGTESEKELLPIEYTLYQNYPNPFNPTTTIKYDLPKTGNIELIIYDILGRKIKTLVNENQQAGRYEISFSAGSFGNASGLASGVYIYQLRTEDFVSTKKMLLLK